MKRKLFCEINPLTYAISVRKERAKRHLQKLFSKTKYAKQKRDALPVVIYKHNSLIRRKLGNVDMHLQENKAINLSQSAPKVSGVVIGPGEVFSFWSLVGNCTKAKGYKSGLAISNGTPQQAIGGGLCQFTNLLHWLALHSPLEIVEHHHHDNIDMFPDYGRQVPFGCGTSIVYNYLDYQLRNNSDTEFQLIVYTNETHLCGELRASKSLEHNYHIIEEDKHFYKKDTDFYRCNKIYRAVIDKRTGNEVKRELIKESNARVLYGEEFIDKELIRVK